MSKYGVIFSPYLDTFHTVYILETDDSIRNLGNKSFQSHKEVFMIMQYFLMAILLFVLLENFFINDVFKLTLRILDKVFKVNFLEFLLQRHNILAYIKHNLTCSNLEDFFNTCRKFSGEFLNI